MKLLRLLLTLGLIVCNGAFTNAKVATECGWPDQADDNLPMGGLFYGHHLVESAVQLLAPRWLLSGTGGSM
jgi:hypothetical protein